MSWQLSSIVLALHPSLDQPLEQLLVSGPTASERLPFMRMQSTGIVLACCIRIPSRTCSSFCPLAVLQRKAGTAAVFHDQNVQQLLVFGSTASGRLELLGTSAASHEKAISRHRSGQLHLHPKQDLQQLLPFGGAAYGRQGRSSTRGEAIAGRFQNPW